MVVYVWGALDNEERRPEERMKAAGMCPSDGNNGSEAQRPGSLSSGQAATRCGALLLPLSAGWWGTAE